MKKQLFFFFFLALTHVAFSQSLTATASKNAILIGDTFHLQLKGNFPQGKQSWLVLDTLPHFEILERSAIDTQSSYLGITLSQTFTVTSWDSGRWQLPPVTIGNVSSAPLTINVTFSSPFDPAQPYHDVKDIIEVKKPIEASWYWYLVFGLILVLLFLLFFPKEKKRTDGGFVADEGAYKKALKALDQLKQQQPPTDEFHTTMIRIFREYLHRRRNIHSFSKTTDDLAIQLSALGLPRPAYQKLVQALRLSDLVKFARFSPGSEENRETLETIRESIVQIEQVKDAV
jgi:hypothetical protein